MSTEETPFETSVAPDVPLGKLVIFDCPDIRLEQLVTFPAEPQARGKSQIREWFESLVFTVLFIVVFTSFVAQATQVPTESMKPTILVGDHFFIEKLAFPGNFPEMVRPYLPRRTIERGDIVVFKSPVEGRIPFVKRVIGLPGDRLEIKNKDVSINGLNLDEPYKIHTDASTYGDAHWTPGDLKIRDNYGPVTVPPGKYFVMGDNRDNSNDSRYWGFVPSDDIMGKPLFVYWSYESDPYVSGEQSFAEWARGYLSIATHFFGRTRWFRMGTMVE